MNGRKITYAWADDASDPNLNLKAAHQIVEQQQVFGIMEGAGGGYGSAAYLDSAGIPVTGMGIDPVWGRHQNMFAPSYFIHYGRPVGQHLG